MTNSLSPAWIGNLLEKFQQPPNGLNLHETLLCENSLNFDTVGLKTPPVTFPILRTTSRKSNWPTVGDRAGIVLGRERAEPPLVPPWSVMLRSNWES